jgi:hypothetical protein
MDWHITLLALSAVFFFKAFIPGRYQRHTRWLIRGFS